MNYYSHHIGDFDKATRHLTRIERSIYRDLMDVYYDTEEPLTLDRAALCRKIIARSPEEATAVEQVLNEFFIESMTGWVHIGCEMGIAAFRASNSQKSAAGKASAAARALIKQQALNGRSTDVATDDGTPVEQTFNGSATNQYPVSKNQRKPKPTSSAGAAGGKPFDQFWAVYPRRVGKADAQRAWTKIKPDAELVDNILTAIAAQIEGHDWKREGGEYIPHPATWLNGGRWLDEVRPYVEPAKKLPAGWWESAEGMKAAGLMLVPPLTPNAGEYPKEFAQRIRVAIGMADPTTNASAAPPVRAPMPAPYEPPKPVGGESVLSDEQKRARRQEVLGAAGSRKILEPEVPEFEEEQE